ncbi:MAG TPA: helix-turn-helix domain-containing protein [Nitrososphaera sp.]|nr:helix-turn-helix domain-containing protein [Nitrososphaera sp.]
MPSIPSVNSLTRMSANVKDLFIQLYDLSPLDVDILFMLISKKNGEPMTLDQISKEVERDRSTTFRPLQKLVTLGLVIKETKTIKDGGYFHVYSAVDMETFKKETERKVRDLKRSLDRLVKKFEADMQDAISSFYQKK